MDKREILEHLIEENNGYLLTSIAIERDITKPFLARYVKEMKMEKVAKGVYITDDVCYVKSNKKSHCFILPNMIG